ncbi:EamA family transporter RarD [Sinomonas halotolerans]|uniref:EamA family transporter RarD n=1 Tax=Sinomonas halotolerans TaxID=1644133 RepID=A0ABU9WY17_9MICC
MTETQNAAASATAASASPPASPAGTSARSASAGRAPAGLLFGIGAYGLWGLLPLYFVLLAAAGPVEIVADRVLFALIVCLVLITATRSWRNLAAVFRSGRMFGALALAAALIGVNWLTYTYGVLTGQAIEASLGYFINPIVSVLLGVLVLKERLRPLQWAAVGVGGIAVAVLSVAHGQLPWIALVLALSFGFYGLVKNRIGGAVDAVTSLSAETAILAPVALGAVVWLAATGSLTLLTEGPTHFWLLAASGIITAVPLLFFGAAARRLPMTTVGLLQYIAPMTQFTLAVTVLGEHMPPERWVGFGIVWLALAILTVDMLLSARRRRTSARAAKALAAR